MGRLFLILIFINCYISKSQSGSVEYFSKITTLTNLNNDSYKEIKEVAHISFIPAKSLINVTISYEEPMVMTFEYFKRTDEANKVIYNVYSNKWSVSDIVISATGGELYMTWLYPKPNDTMIIYGPLTSIK